MESITSAIENEFPRVQPQPQPQYPPPPPQKQQQQQQQQQMGGNGHPARGNLNGFRSAELPVVTYPCKTPRASSFCDPRPSTISKSKFSGISPFMQATSIATHVIRALPPASEGSRRGGMKTRSSIAISDGAVGNSYFLIPETSTRLSRVLSWSNLVNSTAQQGSRPANKDSFSKAGPSKHSRTADLPANEGRKAASFSGGHARRHQTPTCNQDSSRNGGCPPTSPSVTTRQHPSCTPPSATLPTFSVPFPVPCISAPSSCSQLPCIASYDSSSRRSLDSFSFNFAKDGRAKEALPASRPSCHSSFSCAPDLHTSPSHVPIDSSTSLISLTSPQLKLHSTRQPASMRVSLDGPMPAEVGMHKMGPRVGPRTGALLRTRHSAPTC